MSPVRFISVIDFLMSPALDTALEGAGGVLFAFLIFILFIYLFFFFLNIFKLLV